MSVTEHVRAYHLQLAADEHHWLRSWEHCYRYFRRVGPTGVGAERDTAAVQLGFYLASWGMYRKSGFIHRYAYTAHRPLIDCLAVPRFLPLWQQEFGVGQHDVELRPLVLDAVAAVRGAYDPFGRPTDTLVAKVLLGTLGCVPAPDRYFRHGFKAEGNGYKALDGPFIERLLGFCHDNMTDLLSEQDRIEKLGGLRYPVMRLVDMYFWQRGHEHVPGREPGTE